MTKGKRQALVMLELIGAACAAEIWRDLNVRQARQECRSGSREHEATHTHASSGLYSVTACAAIHASVFWLQGINDDFGSITARAG